MGGRGSAGRISAPSLASNSEKLVKRTGSPAGSPAGSDRLKLQGSGYQKPKPSALASRAMRADADALSTPQPSNKAAKRPVGAGADAEVTAEVAGLTVQVADGPRCGGSSDNAGASGDGGEDPFVPDEEEEPFVPEEDVQGSVTQGDNLMFAKARMRRQLGGPNSPAGLLPGSPSVGVGGLPGSPGASIMFVPQQSNGS